MSTDLSTETRNATQTSILASARWCEIKESLVATAGDAVLSVNPFEMPGEVASYPGWAVDNTVGALMFVSFHANPRSRTVYLKLDRSAGGALLTGNYTTQVNAETAVTYDATAGAPADIDALLQAIADAINAASPGMGDVVVADTYSTAGDGVLDAVRLRGVSTGSYTHFTLAAGTSWPVAANMQAYAEMESASLRLYGRASTSVPANIVTGAHYADLLNSWTLIKDYESLTPSGLQEQLNIATQSAVYFELHTLVNSAADDGYNNVVNIAAAVIAPAQVEAPT